jgi:hypothetical protein
MVLAGIPSQPIDPVHLKYRLRNIQTNRADLTHGRLPSMSFSSPQPPVLYGKRLETMSQSAVF